MNNLPYQLSKDEAVAFCDGGVWRTWPDEKIGAFQLFQDTLCVPFDVFHRCIEITLGRPVWTHEFADMQRLRDEYLGKRPTATMADIMTLLNTLCPDKPKIVVHIFYIKAEKPEAADAGG